MNVVRQSAMRPSGRRAVQREKKKKSKYRTQASTGLKQECGTHKCYPYWSSMSERKSILSGVLEQRGCHVGLGGHRRNFGL